MLPAGAVLAPACLVIARPADRYLKIDTCVPLLQASGNNVCIKTQTYSDGRLELGMSQDGAYWAGWPVKSHRCEVTL